MAMKPSLATPRTPQEVLDFTIAEDGVTEKTKWHFMTVKNNNNFKPLFSNDHGPSRHNNSKPARPTSLRTSQSANAISLLTYASEQVSQDIPTQQTASPSFERPPKPRNLFLPLGKCACRCKAATSVGHL